MSGIREIPQEFCRDAASVAVAIEREMVDHVPDAMRIAGLVSNNEEAKAVESEVIKLVGWYMTAARLANRNSEECSRLVFSLAEQRDDLQIKLALAGPLYSARQLQPKLDEAYAALEPFARLAESYFYRYETRPGEWRESHENDPDDRTVYGVNRVEITTGDFRRARKVLENRSSGLADANSKSPIQAREE